MAMGLVLILPRLLSLRPVSPCPPPLLVLCLQCPQGQRCGGASGPRTTSRGCSLYNKITRSITAHHGLQKNSPEVCVCGGCSHDVVGNPQRMQYARIFVVSPPCVAVVKASPCCSHSCSHCCFSYIYTVSNSVLPATLLHPPSTPAAGSLTHTHGGAPAPLQPFVSSVRSSRRVCRQQWTAPYPLHHPPHLAG